MTRMMDRQSHSTADPVWRRPARHPWLDEGALHVWRADLATVSEDVLGLLLPDEHARAERLLSRQKGHLWARSRGVLRALLGRYLQTDPRELYFVRGEHGEPVVVDNRVRSKTSRSPTGMTEAFNFSLSHSAKLAVYAFTAVGRVGVDVEVARRPVNEVAIAGRIFGAAEAARLERLGPIIREREFLRAWTRYEAELKCAAAGIGCGGPGTRGQRPWIAELAPGVRAAGAVAAPRRPREVCLWEWTA
jgi:4'-phosphopantetheinyl transferase